MREIANEYKKIKQKTPGEVDDFSFVDIDGDTHQFSEYLGKWVIVNYWATYCEPCIASFPILNKVASHFKGNAVVLAVEAGETPHHDLKKFVRDMKINYSVIPTQDSVMFALGFIYGVPTTFIVDPHGEIVTTHMGEITINDLDGSIK
ncbi:TlpA disulfide reductase family protein [Thiothrix lacustris]|uniref:TlpA disulfide reductase family protein n=1 Tax=Thiothrix lacustris TaxID=525917 RepID=A0ABY9MVA4_9GAMM|nr:TlpA disulfide reductase family protein [Thiothrix lacustris]WML92115.1 TlpA disulfide reductase family protein [Thiothrix lacustris]